jgi:hypothetical protein
LRIAGDNEIEVSADVSRKTRVVKSEVCVLDRGQRPIPDQTVELRFQRCELKRASASYIDQTP